MDISAVLIFVAPGILFAVLWFFFQRYGRPRLSTPPSQEVEVFVALLIAGVAGVIFYSLLSVQGLILFIMSALGVLARWYTDWKETGERPDLVKPALATFLVYGVLVSLLLQPAPEPDEAAKVPDTIYGMSPASLQFLGLLITALENGYVWKTLIKN